MKIRPIISFVILAGIAVNFSACNFNIQDGQNGPMHNVVVLDSGGTITTHSESHTSSKGSFEIKGSAGYESHTTTHTTTTTGSGIPLAEQLNLWATELFPDYAEIQMDPMEAYPKYKKAQLESFKRMRRKNTISNSYGKAVFPKILLKAYRFSEMKSLTEEVENWIGGLSPDSIKVELGQDVPALKSQPLLCAIIQKDLFVVQTGCVYDGEEWAKDKENFFEKMKVYGAAYAWEIQCNGGALKYHIGGEE